MAVSSASPRSVTVRPLGGLRVAGETAIGPRLALYALVGGMDLDLSRARLGPATTVVKVSLVGGVRVAVPPGVRVDVRGFSVVGGKDVERRADTPPDAPLLRVRSFGLVGGVRVRVAEP
jgi:hypothetical protein